MKRLLGSVDFSVGIPVLLGLSVTGGLAYWVRGEGPLELAVSLLGGAAVGLAARLALRLIGWSARAERDAQELRRALIRGTDWSRLCLEAVSRAQVGSAWVLLDDGSDWRPVAASSVRRPFDAYPAATYFSADAATLVRLPIEHRGLCLGQLAVLPLGDTRPDVAALKRAVLRAFSGEVPPALAAAK